MTIAVGILAADGLVIGADTEENDGYLKTDARKIRVATQTELRGVYNPGVQAVENQPVENARTTAASAIAGAGPAGYIESVTDVLWKDCLRDAGKGREALTKAISQTIGAFYREHVIPFHAYPREDRPDFSLLIGVTHQTKRYLFASEMTAARLYAPYAAVGIGRSLALTLLHRLCPQERTIASAARLAAYVLFHVKASIPGCGRFTDIVALSGGNRFYVTRQSVRELETLFETKFAAVENASLAYALSEANEPSALAELQASFAEFRKHLGPVTFEPPLPVTRQVPPSPKRGRTSRRPSRA